MPQVPIKPSLYVRLRALVKAAMDGFVKAKRQGLGVMQMARLVLREFRRGPRRLVHKIIAFANHGGTAANAKDHAPSEYQQWIASQPGGRPVPHGAGRVSIIMPTCDTPEKFLVEAIESVQGQTYSDWQLCIHDDASRNRQVIKLLREAANADPRIQLSLGSERRGIAGATNAALEMADGHWVAFLDHDDLLDPDAISEMVAAALEGRAQLVYSDHDAVSESGLRSAPFFKPDWNPDLLLSQMYLGHLVMIERRMVEKVGRLRTEYDGAQDYDLVLRCVLVGARVAHVPKVLYHWRQHAGSTSANADSKPYAHHAGRRAIQHFVDIRYPGAKVADGEHTFCYDVRYLTDASPRASIIIPTRDRLDLLQPCLLSLRSVPAGMAYDILIVDNGSKEPETLAWLDQQRAHGVAVIRSDTPFNWSALNNLAAQQARGDLLVFLNNDTEVIAADWLLRLCEVAVRDDVGCVGPLLLYADLTIQHAGVVVGMGGWADHVFKGQPAIHNQHLYVSPLLRRDVLAVTGACMAVERRKFELLGGFDESFLVCGSDVELCLRAHRTGLLNVYVPESRMIHHESKTRDVRDVPEGDFIRSAEAYSPYREMGDPMYNPNLDTYSSTPSLRSP